MSLNDSDHDLLIRIDTKMTTFINDIDISKDVDEKHDIRISKLENARSYMLGAIGLIVLFLGGVAFT